MTHRTTGTRTVDREEPAARGVVRLTDRQERQQGPQAGCEHGETST